MQLVAQWISTKGGVPALVFWDTGSQVTLITQKMAHTLGLVVIPSSPLRLEGIGEGHRPGAATRFKVPLVDTGGRAVAVTAYGVDVIMSPLVGGDIAPMREAFPKVPAGGLVSASGEVSLLMGQDNLSLFPTERRRLGNAALYMSRCGTGWIASGRPPRARSGGSVRLMGVCVIKTADHETTDRQEPQEEDAAICAVSTVAQRWTAPPLHIEGGIFQPYDFLMTESLGTDLPRRCTSCRKCKECKFRTDCLTFKEDQEYQIILEGLRFDKERGIAIAAAMETAAMDEGEFREAAWFLQNRTYVDDATAGADSMERLEALSGEMEAVAKRGGFEFKETLMSGDKEDENGEPRKVLGLIWETEADRLKVDVKLNLGAKRAGLHLMENIELSEGPEKALPEVITKRELWRVAQGQYDPLGLLCAFTIRFKILMRSIVGETSQKVTGWDDPCQQAPTRSSEKWSPTWGNCGPSHSQGPQSPRKRW